MATQEDWRSAGFRQKVISQIEEAVLRSENPIVNMKNPIEMERQVYSKAKTRVAYLAYIARLLVYIRDSRPNAQVQEPTQAPNMGQQLAAEANKDQSSDGVQEHNMVTQEDWRSADFRQEVISQIEKAVKRSENPTVMMKNPSEMENQVYSKAKTRVEYLAYIARLLVYIRNKRPNTQVQEPTQAPNMGQQLVAEANKDGSTETVTPSKQDTSCQVGTFSKDAKKKKTC